MRAHMSSFLNARTGNGFRQVVDDGCRAYVQETRRPWT